MPNRQLLIAFPLFCLSLALMLFVGCITWRFTSEPDRMGVRINTFPKTTPFKITSQGVVAGDVVGYELIGEDLKLAICTVDACYHVIITRATEIIVTNLKGRRELDHTPESVFEILRKTLDCTAAIGISDGNTNMAIIYLSK